MRRRQSQIHGSSKDNDRARSRKAPRAERPGAFAKPGAVQLPPPGTTALFCINTVGNLVDIISQLELRLEDYYAAVRDRSRSNETKLLSYYLGRHYKRFISQLSGVGLEKIGKIRRNKLQEKIRILPEEWLGLITSAPAQITGRSLLDLAMRYNRKLIALYDSLLRQTLCKDAMAFINQLKHLKEVDSVNLKKMLAMNYF